MGSSSSKDKAPSSRAEERRGSKGPAGHGTGSGGGGGDDSGASGLCSPARSGTSETDVGVVLSLNEQQRCNSRTPGAPVRPRIARQGARTGHAWLALA